VNQEEMSLLVDCAFEKWLKSKGVSQDTLSEMLGVLYDPFLRATDSRVPVTIVGFATLAELN